MNIECRYPLIYVYILFPQIKMSSSSNPLTLLVLEKLGLEGDLTRQLRIKYATEQQMLIEKKNRCINVLSSEFTLIAYTNLTTD